MYSIDTSSKWYTAGCIAFATVGLAAIGWWFGPPPTKKLDDTRPSEKNKHQKEEKILQSKMQTLNLASQKENYPLAEKLADDVLAYTEKVWGKNNINYGIILGIPVAGIYENQKKYDQWAKALETAASILKDQGEEVLMELGLLDKLLQCLPHTGKYSKAEEYAKMSQRLRNEALRKNPNSDTFMKFSNSSRLVASFYTDTGKFSQAEAICKGIIDEHLVFDPSSQNAKLFLEQYTDTLHQQGKTEDALNKLEEYKKKIERSKDPTCIDMVLYILQRALTLSFEIDNYQRGYNYIQQINKHNQENRLQRSLQTTLDLVTILIEFRKNEEAEKCISEIFSNLIPFQQPLARSHFLTTLNCQLESGVYKLTLSVNRIRPQRREGDRLEGPEHFRRKLDQCFLVVFFQNTLPNAEPVKVEYPVDNPHKFLIESPPMPKVHKPNLWYKVHIEIYANAKKGQQLGTHEQPIYSYPLGEVLIN